MNPVLLFRRRSAPSGRTCPTAVPLADDEPTAFDTTGSSPEAWFKFTAPADGTVGIDRAPGVPTTASYLGTCDSLGANQGLTGVAVTAGQTLLVVVSSPGSGLLTATFAATPTLASSSVDATGLILTTVWSAEVNHSTGVITLNLSGGGTRSATYRDGDGTNTLTWDIGA